jgi:AraC-like DNA-binding protein
VLRTAPDTTVRRSVSPGAPRAESTLSIRLVWPFARLAASHPGAVGVLVRTGITAEEFGNPDTRIPHATAMRLLADTVATVGDPTLGLRAGEQLEAGDFDVLEYAARSTATLGEAIRCVARYFRLMNDAAEITVIEQSDTAVWRFRVVDDVPQPPAANDFVIASSLGFSRRNVATHEAPLEIRLAHDRPEYAAAYERFGTEVKFGNPFNEIVMRKDRLASPMARVNPQIAAAFELRAQELVSRLEAREGIVGRVRKEIGAQLGSGSATMSATAQRLAMSEATLRRRLQEEGATFTGIVEDLRQRLARQYLEQAGPAISEIAFLLGFSDVASFDRAFKRWMGHSPTKYREKVRR